MNSRHRAAIRFIAFGVLMAAAWIASARWGFCYQHRLSAQGSGPDFQTGISHGAFYFTYHPTNHFGMPRRWTLGPMSGRFRWWFKIWDAGPVNTGHRATVVPLWAAALLLLLAGIVLATRERRRAPAVQACPACRYSLAGLPAGSACPECGGAATGAAPPR